MLRSFHKLRQCKLRVSHGVIRIHGQSVRLYSENQREKDRKRFGFPIFSGFLVFGLGLAVYGLYQRFHDAMTIWPPHVRHNLRRGLYAKRKGDLDGALSYLSRAWEDTKSTPLDSLGADPLLKLSGVAIFLAGVFEGAGLKEEAYRTYEESFFYMINRPSEPILDLTTNSLKVRLSSPKDKIRALSIAYKLGELANTLNKPLAEEEKWLTLSVETLLSIMPEIPEQHKVELRKTLEEFELPSWAMLNDFVAPFEALGSFYSRTGKADYAIILYMQAITFLLHSDSRRSPTVDDKCRGAQIMGNIAELSLRGYPSEKIPSAIVSNAEDRLKEALELTRAARNELPFSRHEFCEEVYAVLLYNFATLKQIAGDVDAAQEYFRQSLQQAETINMQEGISKAELALSKATDIKVE